MGSSISQSTQLLSTPRAQLRKERIACDLGRDVVPHRYETAAPSHVASLPSLTMRSPPPPDRRALLRRRSWSRSHRKLTGNDPAIADPHRTRDRTNLDLTPSCTSRINVAWRAVAIFGRPTEPVFTSERHPRCDQGTCVCPKHTTSPTRAPSAAPIFARKGQSDPGGRRRC